MAKVPDLFEDLKNCYSENEEYSSDIDHLSLNQHMEVPGPGTEPAPQQQQPGPLQ